jgi:fructokinase
VARTIGRLGIPCAFLGRLSTDRFGSILRSRLVDDGVDVTHVVLTDDPTTLAVAEIDIDGEATFRFYLDGTSLVGLTEAHVDRTFLAGIDALHVGTLGLVAEPIASTLVGVVEGMPSTTIVMTDPNCRPQVIADRAAYLRGLERVLARTDIVKVSRDDLTYLAPNTPVERAMSDLLETGSRVVLLTDGAGAVRVLTRTLTWSLPVAPTSVVDTVGAGDAFGGAFLAWIVEAGVRRAELEEESVLQGATEQAIAAARMTTERRGADPPTQEELAAYSR